MSQTQEIQSVYFSNKYNPRKARKYLAKLKLKPIKKVHRSENGFRYRIQDPKKYKDFKSVSHEGNDVIFIYGIL